RSYSGVVRPSTTLKIQMSAATLTNSGTVTKKPAMKLRRSHCIGLDLAARNHREQRQSQDDAVPGEGAESTMANDVEERLHDHRRREKRHDEAERDLRRARGADVVPHFEEIMRKGGRHRRHREEEGE